MASRSAGVPYKRILVSAESGDIEAIRKLLLFRGDAGGDYLHCFVLSALLHKVGDDVFAEACRKIAPRPGLKSCVAEALAMAKMPDLAELYPQTAAALSVEP